MAGLKINKKYKKLCKNQKLARKNEIISEYNNKTSFLNEEKITLIKKQKDSTSSIKSLGIDLIKSKKDMEEIQLQNSYAFYILASLILDIFGNFATINYQSIRACKNHGRFKGWIEFNTINCQSSTFTKIVVFFINRFNINSIQRNKSRIPRSLFFKILKLNKITSMHSFPVLKVSTTIELIFLPSTTNKAASYFF